MISKQNSVIIMDSAVQCAAELLVPVRSFLMGVTSVLINGKKKIDLPGGFV